MVDIRKTFPGSEYLDALDRAVYYTAAFEDVPKSKAKYAAGMFLGEFLSLPLHEVMHKLASDLFGYHTTIHIPRILGGDIYQSLFPYTFQLSSDLNTYTQGDPKFNLHGLATSMAPYPLHSAIGILLINDGVRRRNPFEIGAGVINVLSPLTNCIGDFRTFAYRLVDYLYNGLNIVPNYPDITSTENIAYTFTGICLAALYYKAVRSFVNLSRVNEVIAEDTDKND